MTERITEDQIHNVAVYVDPPSHHYLNDRLFDLGPCRLNGDQLLAPYVYLKELLTARGITVRTADHLPPEQSNGLNIYVSLGNMQKLHDLDELSQRSDVVLSAFIALECPIVEPSLYRGLKRIERYYKRIFSWSDSETLNRFVGKDIKFEPFFWPQSFNDVHEDIWNRTNRKFLVMINANKLPRIYWQELYTKRMEIVEFFSRTEEIDLYGKGWNEPSMRLGHTWVPWTFRALHDKFLTHWDRYRPDPLLVAARRVYCGPAESKANTLGGYKFALCFENATLKGWITEKIFDCFFAGTVPVYWGAPDIERYVPAECFIDMRRFANYEELADFLRSLGEEEIRQYKQNAREYLRSPLYYPFTKQAFGDLFCRLVEEDSGIQPTS